MRNDTRNKAIIAIVVLLIVMSAGAGIALFRMHAETVSQSPEPAPAATEATASEEQAETAAAVEDSQPLATLFFASDYQPQVNWPAPKENLTGILEAVKTAGKDPDEIIICGDYTNHRELNNHHLSPEESIAEIRSLMEERFPNLESENMLFLQGNHDQLTESIADSGLHEFDDYLIYAVNTQPDYPWSQGVTIGALKKVRKTSKEMKKCFDELIEQGESRPVFVTIHVPLHFSARTSTRHSTGDNLYASLLFNVINEAGRSLDIVCIYGHNHSKGWDCYMGGSSVYKAKGETLLVPAFAKTDIKTDRYTEETLNFTYLNAGYLGYYMNCGPKEIDNGTVDQYHAADETLTGTVCEIWPDELVLTRYDAEGEHVLGADGEADPYKDYIDRGLIGEEHYNHQTDSPQTVERR